MSIFIRFSFCLALAAPIWLAAQAQQNIPLFEPEDAVEVWKFDNGQEFPGATGSISVDASAGRGGRPSLKLVGDFTGGGGYVQAGRKLEDIDVRTLSLWVKSAETDRFTLRLGDASGQTHQIVIKLKPGTDWQRVEFPVERFFARRGQADAVTTVANYESWGGAKDGNWHGPARGLYLLLGKLGEDSVRTLWLSDIEIEPKPTPVAGAELKTEIQLAEVVDGVHDWGFSNGPEFKGATGSLTTVDGQLKLAGNFTGGGAYVAAIRDLSGIGAAAVPAIRMRVKTTNAKSVSIQMVDATGQTHQRKGVKIIADGEWQDFELIPAEIAGGEHWGGSNDGKWHDPPRQMVISLTSQSDETNNQPDLLLTDVRAEAVFPVFAQPAAFVSTEPIVLARTLEDVQTPITSVSASFDASPGQWEIGLVYRSDLHSPDNSYNGVLHLECLNSGGEIIESIGVADVFGRHDPTSIKKVVELPAGVASARFQAQLNKTYGDFRIEDLTAAYLAPAPRRDDRIQQLLFSTAQLGNLLFPEDSRKIGATIEATKPLSEGQRTLTYVVRDYWGAEHMRQASVELGAPAKQKDRFAYEATLDLSDVPLEIGRYYELHAEIGGKSEGGVQTEPFRNHTSFAILPEAVTRKFKPEEVPFTSRNWDNRISEYIRLTDRLGVRICGLWGGWSPKPPYKPEAPGLDLVQELGMGWLTTTPAAAIERGKDDEWTEAALRQGVRNFLAEYGHVRPLIINLGNEPHGIGERVVKNVAAYRIIYDEIKKVDPSVPVVATSVEPNEEYFRNGYGQWCDAYDFHIYEQPENVRRTMDEYGGLMKKYDVVKPLWSTELGLNSQGQPRHEVAVQVFKKFSTFFAAGGENVSWFGLLYPDPDGKQHGSSGDSHNIFDCRFNRYAPRLDAVAYYHAVNSIAIKKFVEERRYENGVHAFLFRDRDGRSLSVLWNENGRADVQIPLPGVQQLLVRRIDGASAELNAAGEGITLSVTADPLCLLYEGGEGSLAQELATPLATLETNGNPLEFRVAADGAAVSAPPFWTVKSLPDSWYSLEPPADSQVREVEVRVRLKDGRGQLYHRAPTGG